MDEFMRKLRELNGKRVKVVLTHKLFGAATYVVENLVPIVDEHKIGVKIKNQEKFVYKKDIIYEDRNSIGDGQLTIKIEKA